MSIEPQQRRQREREGRDRTERRQREGKEKQRYARGKEATNQREREPQKSFRCERRNARFALVDAQEAAAIEQIACPQATSRQPSDKQPLRPPVPLSTAASVVVCCGRAQLTFVRSVLSAAIGRGKSVTFKS